MPATNTVQLIPPGERAPFVPQEVKAYIAHDPMADRRLWHSVILQAAQDALVDAHQAEWTTVQRDAHDAIKWLTQFNEEMVKVCSLAGVSSQRIMSLARRKLFPLIALYEDKAGLLRIEADLLAGQAKADALKTAGRYEKSAALIKAGQRGA
jgi:hypothetical protein